MGSEITGQDLPLLESPGEAIPAPERPSRWLPLLSWRDYPALLQHQRLLRDVERAAAASLDGLRRTLEERGSVAGAQERDLLSGGLRHMEAAQAAAEEAGEDLYRFRSAGKRPD